MKKPGIGRHIASGLAFIILLVVLPVLLLVAVPIVLVLKILGVDLKRDRSAEEVATYIRDFIENTGGNQDWDDFTSVTITAPELETIRKQAAEIPLPVDSAGVEKLKGFLEKAEALKNETAAQDQIDQKA